MTKLRKTWRPAFAFYYSKLADMADAVAMQPVRRPLRVAVRIKNEGGLVANVQRIMQEPA